MHRTATQHATRTARLGTAACGNQGTSREHPRVSQLLDKDVAVGVEGAIACLMGRSRTPALQQDYIQNQSLLLIGVCHHIVCYFIFFIYVTLTQVITSSTFYPPLRYTSKVHTIVLLYSQYVQY